MVLELNDEQAETLRFYLVDCICSAKSIGAESYADTLEQIFEMLGAKKDDIVQLSDIPW